MCSEGEAAHEGGEHGRHRGRLGAHGQGEEPRPDDLVDETARAGEYVDGDDAPVVHATKDSSLPFVLVRDPGLVLGR